MIDQGQVKTPEELSRLGRELASARKVVEGYCEVCGTPFTGHTWRRYCSNKCAVRAHRQRRRVAAEVDPKIALFDNLRGTPDLGTP